MNDKVPIPINKFPDTNQNAYPNFTIFMFSAYFQKFLQLLSQFHYNLANNTFYNIY